MGLKKLLLPIQLMKQIVNYYRRNQEAKKRVEAREKSFNRTIVGLKYYCYRRVPQSSSFTRTIIGLKFVLGCKTSPLKKLFYSNYYRIEMMVF
jgi:hypothetical protein